MKEHDELDSDVNRRLNLNFNLKNIGDAMIIRTFEREREKCERLSFGDLIKTLALRGLSCLPDYTEIMMQATADVSVCKSGVLGKNSPEFKEKLLKKIGKTKAVTPAGNPTPTVAILPDPIVAAPVVQAPAAPTYVPEPVVIPVPTPAVVPAPVYIQVPTPDPAPAVEKQVFRCPADDLSDF